LRVAAVTSEKLVTETRDSSEPRRKGKSAVGSSYQTMASEDLLAVVAVIFGVAQ
jgi:hypothetical protein